MLMGPWSGASTSSKSCGRSARTATSRVQLLLEGDAGIGKTVLWEAGLAIASAAGHTVLRCRPAAAEAQLSFAALADLLVDVLDEALPALAAPQRRALEVALLLDDAEGSPPDVRALAGAFLGVLRHASSSASVLVAIDDVQWLDEPSRTVLEFAVRRLGVEPVGVLASRRGTGGEPPLGLGQALRRSGSSSWRWPR